MQRRPLLIAAASGLLAAGAARGQSATEAHVKARMAFNLARFTQWPDAAFAEAAAPHLWCAAVREGAQAAALAALAGEGIGSRTIKLMSKCGSATLLIPPRGADDVVVGLGALCRLASSSVATCHVLYIEAEVERQAAVHLANAANLPVLTIGDGEGFSQRGIVGLVNVNDSIRFDINLSRMRAAQLNISSQVLKLARRVHE